MHKEILDNNQLSLLDLVKSFRREFYLVGGTAIALHIGHRRSIDFDLFKATPFQTKKILDKIQKQEHKYLITRNVSGQLNLIISDVKFTFFEYPYIIEASEDFEKKIKLPTLLDLAAMKAFALGRRSKWKDYVDLYFILKNHFTFNEISTRAEELFDQQFSGKLFRGQLSYFDDINYEEEVEYLIPHPPTENEIKEFLINTSINF
ncbi:nucleotidyl transferase AbiEii/AbiGii toxin family protein [Petrimonas sp.]|jgi:hypothetical protein|uniref:nucleotidyl transferase AbiEii/AbiGii toxin family protein n=1 Tax=Petrimonas sp. TaxID=2023866 RepID=UPI001BD27746|nr:nucleotidyl transferase AbiEii/AbiGii toxin family protein [Petrimonas sp.]MEA5045637.1 nucleotidyl transferase AbiEii/AbiGii toxin family protein [Petrimonas sp.]